VELEFFLCIVNLMSRAHGLVDLVVARCTVDPRTSAWWQLIGALAAWRSGLPGLATMEGKGRGANGGSHQSVGGQRGSLVWLGGDEECWWWFGALGEGVRGM
jgi:hypothetical protein